jgi:hypothetical protein
MLFCLMEDAMAEPVDDDARAKFTGEMFGVRVMLHVIVRELARVPGQRADFVGLFRESCMRGIDAIDIEGFPAETVAQVRAGARQIVVDLLPRPRNDG